MLSWLIILIFTLGYLGIAFEHSIRINKSATALVTGVLCWTVYIFFAEDKALVNEALDHHLGHIAQILFFLLGAMTIVELMDAHDGFEMITRRIRTRDKRSLLPVVGLITFFLSALLDNLTTTIVMVSLIRKLVAETRDRWILAGLIVIAANAGGAWSPIGDVTTTMLWIGGQISAFAIITQLILPSLVCFGVPLLVLRGYFKGQIRVPEKPFQRGGETRSTPRERAIVFYTGLFFLLTVPVFKTLTHLPPFMGILIGLGLMWMITEAIHSGKDEEDRKNFTVAFALRKIDTPSILFFLGILLAVAALEATGQLETAARVMNQQIGEEKVIVPLIGLLSSVVDNVPLVAAAQGMYPLPTYPPDHLFWEFLAYCTGTGGSILIIGSAAGVAAMGIERIPFMWYLKKIGWLALLGYAAGAAVYLLQGWLF